MKKIANMIGLAISSLVLLLSAGCSNSVDGTVSGVGQLMMKDSISNNVNSINTPYATKTLNVIATSKEDVVEFRNNDSRTVLPGKLNSSDLSFYMWGQNVLDGTAIETRWVNFTETDAGNYTEGSVDIDLPASSFKLKLAAYYNSEVASGSAIVSGKELDKAILYGVATVDLRNNESVRFFLTPNNLKGNADVQITIKTMDYAGTALAAWSDPRYYAEINLQKLDDGTNVVLPGGKKAYHGITEADTGTTIYSPITGYEAASEGAYDWTATGELAHADGLLYHLEDVPSGAYNLVVKFVNKTDNKAFYYSERVLVLANQPIEAEVIVPKIIDVAPDRPSNLKVGYVDPVAGDRDPDSYYVSFEWKDNAKNEEYYVLQLMEVSGDRSDDAGLGWKEDGTNLGLSTNAVEALKCVAAVPNSPTPVADGETGYDDYTAAKAAFEAKAALATTAWEAEVGTASELVTYNKSFYQDFTTYYIAGSLDKNSESVTLQLPLGKVYMARICAWNAFCNEIDPKAASNGAFKVKQDWVYAGTFSLTSTKETDAGAQTNMNPFVINYNTADGTDGDTKTPKQWPKVTDNKEAFVSGGEKAPVGISRYRLEYNLHEGMFKETDANGKLKVPGVDVTTSVSNYHDSTQSVMEFHTATVEGTEIISPIIYRYDTDKYCSLFDGQGNVWSSWKKDSVEGTVIDKTPGAKHPKHFRYIEWKSLVASGGDTLEHGEAYTANADGTRTSKAVYPYDKNLYVKENVANYYVNSTQGYLLEPAVTPAGTDALEKVEAVSSDHKVYLRSTLANYMAVENLELFANYNATKGDYKIHNDEDYALTSKNIRVYKERIGVLPSTLKYANYYDGIDSDACYNNGEINGSAFKISSYYTQITFELLETNDETQHDDLYRNVALEIKKQGAYSAVYNKLSGEKGLTKPVADKIGSGSDGKEPLTAQNHTSWKFNVPISSFKNGKYEVTFKAYSEVRADTPYTCVLEFELTDDSTTYSYTPTTFSSGKNIYICTSAVAATYTALAEQVTYESAIADSITHKCYKKVGSDYVVVPKEEFVPGQQYCGAATATAKTYSSTASKYTSEAEAKKASADSNIYDRTATVRY